MRHLWTLQGRPLGLRLGTLAAVAIAALAVAGSANPAPASGLSASPALLDFGNVPVGTAATLPVTLTNTGTDTILGIEGAFRGGPDATWIASFANCPSGGAPLAPGQSCDVLVTFQPTRTGRKGTHLVLYDNLGDRLSVRMVGYGV